MVKAVNRINLRQLAEAFITGVSQGLERVRLVIGVPWTYVAVVIVSCKQIKRGHYFCSNGRVPDQPFGLVAAAVQPLNVGQ